MYRLQKWERKYPDKEEYKVKGGLVEALLYEEGVRIPGSMGGGLIRFVSDTLTSISVADRVSPEKSTVLRIGALYKKSDTPPLVVRQITEVLGPGEIIDLQGRVVGSLEEAWNW